MVSETNELRGDTVFVVCGVVKKDVRWSTDDVVESKSRRGGGESRGSEGVSEGVSERESKEKKTPKFKLGRFR